MTFSENGFEIVRNVIDTQLLNLLKTEFEMIRDLHYVNRKTNNLYKFGDEQSPKSFSMYNVTCFEALCLLLTDKISEVIEKKLFPCYSYARIYYEGATLEPHTDRPSCEYSSTVCIDSTDLWDFYIVDRKGYKNIVKLNPGDMCVYSGTDLIHWREKYKGQKQIQCFLHYVDQSGKFKNFKYDKRPMMGFSPEPKEKKSIIYT